MQTFRACVQYGDWEGTAAADNSGQIAIHKYLRDRGLLHPQEFLLGVSLWVGENTNGKINQVVVRAYIYSGTDTLERVQAALDSSSEPVAVRTADVKLSLDEFVGLFKRFAVTLTWRGLDLEGREYTEKGKALAR